MSEKKLSEHEQIFAEYREKYKDRKSVLFIDGVVDKSCYGSASCGEILFFLKEAYSREQRKGEWNLAEHLAVDRPWGMWNRVGEWTCGISETSREALAPYRSFTETEKHEALRKISVINIKKVNGVSQSDDRDLDAYAESNSELLRRQIESVKPKVIVCGNTFQHLKKIFGVYPAHRNENWYYRLDLGGLKQVLVLDYYHPAVQYPSLLTYYGIVNIYQQALLDQAEEERD